MKCQYCGNLGNTVEGEPCQTCGAPVIFKQDPIEKGDPFFYNGYMLWPERNFWKDDRTIHFLLGDRLVETITISKLTLNQLVGEGQSFLPLFWDLFKVTQGEEEVLRIKELNTRYPAIFEVRRIENPEKQYLASLTYDDLIKTYKKESVETR
jgi:hypothetical protein